MELTKKTKLKTCPHKTKCRDIVKQLRGPLIPVLPALRNDESLDIDATLKWIDWELENGVKLFWTTPGTTQFMNMTEKEIYDLTKALAKLIKGRGIFIASCDLSTRETIKFINFAAEAGVDIVKVCPDYRWKPTDEAILEHYRTIAAVSEIPLLGYTCAVPGLTQGMSTELLKKIAEIPQFVGIKNDSGDFRAQQYYLRTVRQLGSPDEFAIMTGGCMDAFLYNYDFGARAYGDVVAMYQPKTSLEFYEDIVHRRREKARRIIQDFEEPLFEAVPQYGYLMMWSWLRTALCLKGLFKSNNTRFPFRRLNIEEIKQVRQLLESQNAL